MIEVNFGSLVKTTVLKVVTLYEGSKVTKTVQDMRTKKGRVFPVLVLGVIDEQERITQAWIEERMNALGWYTKPAKKAKKK